MPSNKSKIAAGARPLKGFKILSLALNLPGPAALMRLASLGARCTKIEGPAGDLMQQYSPQAFVALHQGVKVIPADLKTMVGRKILARELTKTDILLTSFRPSALAKMGLGQAHLRKQYPNLAHVAIVGQTGSMANKPGHDLTYMAENGLVEGINTPASLYADMAGSLLAVNAVLQCALLLKAGQLPGRVEVALADAAAYLALPRQWGLTSAQGIVGGAHAGYRVYKCQDGRVAVAALEPHFALRLCLTARLGEQAALEMQHPSTHHALERFFANQTRQALDKLALEQDIPLHTMPES
jgi:alpha-methylacyl-CoA racemase